MEANTVDCGSSSQHGRHGISYVEGVTQVREVPGATIFLACAFRRRTLDDLRFKVAHRGWSSRSRNCRVRNRGKLAFRASIERNARRANLLTVPLVASLRIEDRYKSAIDRIKNTAIQYGRNPEDIGLLAVSKTRTVEEIRTLAQIGHFDFGENYVVDALPKIQATGSLGLTWHYVGTIQSNKTKLIAQHFDWVQSVDRANIARRLNDARSREPLNVCIQVNVDDEPQKSGIRIEEVADLVKEIQKLPRLRLRGLMSIPKARSIPEESRTAFSTLYRLFQELRPSVSEYWDTLSMGMTSDYEIAIQEGATLVRLGTAIFGPRG